MENKSVQAVNSMRQHEPAQSDSEYAITEHLLNLKDSDQLNNINKFHITSELNTINIQLNKNQNHASVPSWKTINTHLPIPLYSFSIFK